MKGETAESSGHDKPELGAEVNNRRTVVALRRSAIALSKREFVIDIPSMISGPPACAKAQVGGPFLQFSLMSDGQVSSDVAKRRSRSYLPTRI